MLLSISIDGDKPNTYKIEEDTFTIGRSSGATLQIKVDSISRLHLQIRKSEDGQLFIMDMGSSNGTYLNNERLSPNEEIQWHSFFPISLSHKILITLIHEQQEQSQETQPKKDFPPANLNHSKSMTPRTESETVVRKLNFPSSQKKKPANTTFIFTAILTLAIGFLIFTKYQDDGEKQPKEETAQLNAINLMTPLLAKLMNEKKCLKENEKKFCQLLNITSDELEGALTHDNNLYLFINYEKRLKEVLFDPSFSFADKKNQLTYLMVFFVFSDSHRNLVQVLNLKNIIMIDTSSAPEKINHTLKVSQENLFKLSSTDIETIKNMVLKNDHSLYESVLKTLFEVQSIY